MIHAGDGIFQRSAFEPFLSGYKNGITFHAIAPLLQVVHLYHKGAGHAKTIILLSIAYPAPIVWDCLQCILRSHYNPRAHELHAHKTTFETACQLVLLSCILLLLMIYMKHNMILILI